MQNLERNYNEQGAGPIPQQLFWLHRLRCSFMFQKHFVDVQPSLVTLKSPGSPVTPHIKLWGGLILHVSTVKATADANPAPVTWVWKVSQQGFHYLINTIQWPPPSLFSMELIVRLY